MSKPKISFLIILTDSETALNNSILSPGKLQAKVFLIHNMLDGILSIDSAITHPMEINPSGAIGLKTFNF